MNFGISFDLFVETGGPESKVGFIPYSFYLPVGLGSDVGVLLEF